MSERGTILEEILARKRVEVARLGERAGELDRRAAEAPPSRGFASALRRGERVAVIAEFKRRSPSAGEISPGAEPGATARAYERGGAAALSVLTDGPGFGGGLDDLRAARGSTSLPVLRKDFLIDPLQVLESRAAGADAVLLIVRALDDARLGAMLAACRERGMDALVEVHDEAELDRALAAGARVVGVNARDLATFRVDLGRALELVAGVPADRTAVAESGIGRPEDAAACGAAGADAVLVGTRLMAEGDPERAVSGLAAAGRRRPRAPGVKICGCRRPADAGAAVEAGATHVGVVFAESPRRMEAEEAAAVVRAASGRARPVGVFVDAGPEEVLDLARRTGVEVAQLHGAEGPETCAALRAAGLEVWKALRPRSREELATGAARYLGSVDAILVDGRSPEMAGGTGTAFPHAWLDGLRERLERAGVPLVLAGGLSPENVGEAVREARPSLVDVSSGVERRPGEKDGERIRAFVRAAGRREREAGVR